MLLRLTHRLNPFLKTDHAPQFQLKRHPNHGLMCIKIQPTPSMHQRTHKLRCWINNTNIIIIGIINENGSIMVDADHLRIIQPIEAKQLIFESGLPAQPGKRVYIPQFNFYSSYAVIPTACNINDSRINIHIMLKSRFWRCQVDQLDPARVDPTPR